MCVQMMMVLSAPPDAKRFPSREYDTVNTVSLCPCAARQPTLSFALGLWRFVMHRSIGRARAALQRRARGLERPRLEQRAR